jgi:prepilin-type N-terminal cleavage/methylation domain-containing protein
MDFMAKNRNKGFSLIEVVIGVAVLTILLTPVVKQLAQTMRTNRLAKEQQYVNECATSLMEYAQKTGFTALEKEVSDDKKSSFTRTCKLLVIDPSNDIKTLTDSGYAVAGTSDSLNYTVKSYDFDSVALGSRQTYYNRLLTLDDLANKISEFTFAKYGGTGDETYGLNIYYKDIDSALDLTLPSGYQYASDGSIVEYTTEEVGGKTYTYISGIVCEVKDGSASVIDPNTSQLASMHDLVSTQVALVNGDISNFDEQAREDINVAILSYLKENANETYQKLISSDNASERLTSSSDYLNGLKKTTTITIDKGDTDKYEGYYLVRVDVKYSISNISVTVKVGDTDISVPLNYNAEYNVYAQTFPFKKVDDNGNALKESEYASVPEVYIEYQPFLIIDQKNDDGSRDGSYATNDYIYIKNFVDGAKIYLYKPTTDYVVATGGTHTLDTDSSNVYRQGADSADKVKIYLKQLVATNDSGVATEGKSTYMYTNLDLTTTATTVSTKAGQFIYGDTASNSGSDVTNFSQVNPTYEDAESSAGSKLYLKDVSDDTSVRDRLYTATVTISPVDDGVNTVTLTGAKGGN